MLAGLDANAASVAAVVATAVVVVVILFCIIGNILIILAILLNRRMRKRKNWFYVSLAVADLLVGTCVMTFALANDMMGRWVFGETFCQIWISLDVMCSTASIVNISAIAFDRYMHVRSPFTYDRLMNRVRMILFIVAVWTLSIAISFIPIKLGWHHDTVHRQASLATQNLSNANFATLCDLAANTDDSDDDAEANANANWTSKAPASYDFDRELPSASDAEEHIHDQCKFSVNATYAIASSCVSFFVPSVCLALVYARLHKIARSHYAAIQQTTVSSVHTLNVPVARSRRTSERTEEQRRLDSSSSSPTRVPLTNGSNKLRAADFDNGSADADADASSCQRRVAQPDWSCTHKNKSQQGKFFQERKATITLGFLIGVFLICWSPFFFCNVVAPFCKSCISDFLFALVTYLGYSNSALDPIAIFLTNNDFRKSLLRMLSACRPRREQQIRLRHVSNSFQRSFS